MFSWWFLATCPSNRTIAQASPQLCFSWIKWPMPPGLGKLCFLWFLMLPQVFGQMNPLKRLLIRCDSMQICGSLWFINTKLVLGGWNLPYKYWKHPTLLQYLQAIRTVISWIPAFLMWLPAFAVALHFLTISAGCNPYISLYLLHISCYIYNIYIIYLVSCLFS